MSLKNGKRSRKSIYLVIMKSISDDKKASKT